MKVTELKLGSSSTNTRKFTAKDSESPGSSTAGEMQFSSSKVTPASVTTKVASTSATLPNSHL